MDGAMNRILQKWMLGQEPFSDERIVCYQEYMKEVFDLLTRYGGDPNRKDGGGRTVRTMAEEAGREEILEYLALNET